MNQWIINLTTRMLRRLTYFLALLAFAACAGTVDPETQEPDAPAGNPMEEVPEGVLRIFADKTEIAADGNEEVTFTVMFGKEDVSNARTLQIIREYEGEEKYMSYGANKFSTVTAGTYKFSAKYYFGGNHYTDNSVSVDARQFFSGEEKAYKQRLLGTLFTSTGCVYCPRAATELKELQNANPGVISLVSFHAHMDNPPADPMVIQETYDFLRILGGSKGLPAFYWNMNKETYTGGSVYRESFENEMKSYTPHCGVCIDAGTEGKISIGITSNLPLVYRYLVFIVEDGIVATQVDDQNYVHNNVVRKVLTSEKGDKINDNLPFTVGVEAKASKEIVVSPDWNKDNLRVIVAAMTSSDGGYTFIVNNVAECRLGEKVDYQYVE